MRRLGSLITLLAVGAYGASACSSDEETPPPGAGGSAGAAASSGTGGGVDDCLPRSCCRDGIVTTTYAPCEKLQSVCVLGCRADLPEMGCVTTNSLGGEEEAMAFAQSLCVGDGSAGKGGAGAGGMSGGAGNGGLGGQPIEGGAGGQGGEGGATDGGMGGEGGR